MSLRRHAFIGLGANLGDALPTLRSAAKQLQDLPQCRWLAGSHLYRSAPIDSSGPDYWNAVALLESDLEPLALLGQLQVIEQGFGRERPYRNAPRTLDLDLLVFGDLECHGPELELPHPRLHRRAFVLQPLLELAPDLGLPGLGPLHAYLPSVADQVISRSGERLEDRYCVSSK